MRKIIVEKDDNNRIFIVTFDYRPHLVDGVRNIPSAKFIKKIKSWQIKVDHISANALEIYAAEHDFEIDNEAQEIIDEFKKPVSDHIEIPTLKRTLRDFQHIGVAKAIKFERCFIADQMGLGKTFESIAIVEKLNAFPALVICPASLKYNWKKEVDLSVDRNVTIIEGLPKEIIGPESKPVGMENIDYVNDSELEYVVINYDILYRTRKGKEVTDVINHKDILKTIPFKSIIIDESQLCKNYKSQRTQAVKEIAKKIRYRFALSGTPMLNRPQELVSQLEIIDRLETMGGFWGYVKTYCDAKETQFGWDFSGFSNLMELHTKLIETCFIRRTKKDVLKELPDKQRTMIPIKIDNQSEYDLAKKNFTKWAKENLTVDTTKIEEELKDNILLSHSQKTMIIHAKVRQTLLGRKKAEAMVQLEYLKQITAKGKISAFKNFINNFIESGEKIVVFATHKHIYKELIEEYKDVCVYVVGGMNSKKKQEAVDRFQTEKKVQVFIGALDSAGIGLTLTEASSVAFIEFGWTPSIHDQAEDRTHRIGQKNAVNCYYIYGKETIDEDILELIEEKRKVLDAVTDGKDIKDSDKDLEKIINKFISEEN